MQETKNASHDTIDKINLILKQLSDLKVECKNRIELNNSQLDRDIHTLANEIKTMFDIAKIKITNANKVKVSPVFSPTRKISDILLKLKEELESKIAKNRQILDQHPGIKGIFQNILNKLVYLINHFKKKKIDFFVFNVSPQRKTMNEIEDKLQEIYTA